MTKRSYIRIVSYIGFMLAVIVISSVMSATNMKAYKTELEVSYQQSLAEFAECLDKVDTDITKSLVSNSKGEVYDLSRDLYAQCSTAKNAMSRLPVSQMELGNAYKFLSQCSDYAQYIGGKIDKNEIITEEEHQNLKNLLGYAQKFSEQAKDMVATVNAGAMITEGEVKSVNQINISPLSNSFSAGAEIFEDFPTLLYDGPFSDQVLNKASKLVKSGDVKTREECRKIFASAIGADVNNVSYETDDKSKIPCYTFKCGRYTGLVTKQGGYIKEILYSGKIQNSNITAENACNLAVNALEELGYSNMTVCYYNVENNICTVNCAYQKDNVCYYSDLIKVGISMNDGELVSVDSKTYLTNHTNRKPKIAKLSTNQARKKLSKYLEVKKSKMCVIPKESGKEIQCYEFTCKSKDTGEDTLVYINCDTGEEEDIMIVLKSASGTLVK